MYLLSLRVLTMVGKCDLVLLGCEFLKIYHCSYNNISYYIYNNNDFVFSIICCVLCFFYLFLNLNFMFFCLLKNVIDVTIFSVDIYLSLFFEVLIIK